MCTRALVCSGAKCKVKISGSIAFIKTVPGGIPILHTTVLCIPSQRASVLIS